MGPGGIATIIAASSLLVIAIAISYAVIRVGRFIDEAKASLKAVTEETTPLIEEVHTTVTRKRRRRLSDPHKWNPPRSVRAGCASLNLITVKVYCTQ